MNMQSTDTSPAYTIGQLQQARAYLRTKLKQMSSRFGSESSASDGELTFALAERNFIQGNLERVERQLLLAKVSNAVSNDKVGIGNVVYIQRGNDVRAIMLIPAVDADPNIEYVSEKSQLGRALVGRRVGGSVEIRTSFGKQNYGILRIE